MPIEENGNYEDLVFLAKTFPLASTPLATFAYQ
jgi:hypothetical protein